MEKIVDGYILNSGNCEILKKAIHKYLMEVLKEEEYLNSLEKCYAEAYRVKVQGVKKLTPSLVKAWLQGLPLCTEYRTWSILVMMFKWLGLSETEAEKEADELYSNESKYKTTATDMDDFYWYTMGQFICFKVKEV